MIVDAHLDIAYNTLSHGRDYTQSVDAAREHEGQRAEDIAVVGLPDALAGGVGLVFGTLFVAPSEAAHISPLVYRTTEEAHAQALDQLAVYRRLAERPDMMLIETQHDLAALVAAREQGEVVQGIVVLMEGADPIRVPHEVADWQSRGVRIIGPAWKKTRYSCGTGFPGPLTPEGRVLMGEMNRAQIALDVSHMAEESFWQALELFDGPVIASHSNCRALVSEFRPDRQLSDAMIKALIERDGVVGVVLYNKFLLDGWMVEQGKQAVGLDIIVRHIDHICQLAGDARHVGIGSDFDGGFGCEAIPDKLDTIADLSKIGIVLSKHGYTEADIAAILGGNWLRKLEHILPA
jgi:membrane dipeptidase